MKNKKAELSMETVIIAIVVLLVLVVIFTIFTRYMARSGKSFGDLFTKVDKDLGKTDDTQSGTSVTVYSNEPQSVTVGKEEFTITSVVSSDIATVDVKDSADKNVECNYGTPWTFKKGERKCCENTEKDICVKYESVSSTGEDGDKISLKTFSRSEWLTHDGEDGMSETLYQDKAKGTKSIIFWTTAGKYSMELLRVDDSLLETRHVNMLVNKFTLKSKNDKVAVCDGVEEGSAGEKSFRVNQGASEECDNTFVLTVDQVSGKNNYAEITITNVKSAESETLPEGTGGISEETQTE